MKRERCSVTIITLNEDKHLTDCLKSVQWADEIVLVDSGSADKTLEIAREFGCNVFFNAWPGMREQKNVAAEKATGPWILNLDADERVSPDLRQQILEVLQNPSHDGYRFPRKNYFLGKWMRHGGWYPDAVLRLYLKSEGTFKGINPHAEVEFTQGSSIGDLPAPLIHYTYADLQQYVTKQYAYANAAAREIYTSRKPGSVSMVRIAIKTGWKFVETYFLKRGFLDGAHGLIAALGSTFSAFLKQARLWELCRQGREADGKGG